MPQSPQLINNIEWHHDGEQIEYPAAFNAMELRAAAIAQGDARELVWLLEHPALYTAGTSADPAELLNPQFQVYNAGRGGRYTYHGPGQRIGYVMLNLGKHGRDVRRFVYGLEGWMISALGALGVEAWRAPGRIGLWADDHGQEAKIGAIGVRVRRWVTLHGFSINVNPDLSHFRGIIPCGLAEFPVTSLHKLGINVTMEALDSALFDSFPGFIDSLQSVKNIS